MNHASGNEGEQVEQQLTAYTPSYLDHLQAWVDRLPVTYWVVYPSLGVVMFGLGILIQWLEKSGTLRDWHPTYFLVMVQTPYILWLLHHLDRYALRALQMFKPALTVDDAGGAALQRQIATLPARTSLWMHLAVVLFFLVLMTGSRMQGPGGSPLSSVEFGATPFGYYSLFLFVILWLANGFLFYHTIHQLRAIHRIYTRHAAIDPFHQGPLHAFSGLAARTAIGWAVPSLPWIFLDPGLSSLVLSLIFALAGVAAFISPLAGVHQLLEKEKRQLLDENSGQIREVIADLSSQLKEPGYGEALGHIDEALSGLERARTAIKGIPTWPWRADTLRQVIAALILPVVVWLLQYFLGQLLAG